MFTHAPALHVSAVHDGRPVLTAPAVRELRDRAGALYGFDLAGKLLAVDRAEGEVRVAGLVAPPQLARGKFDVVVEATGSPPIVQQGLEMLRKRGILVVVGIQLLSLGLITELITSHHEERVPAEERAHAMVDEVLS